MGLSRIKTVSILSKVEFLHLVRSTKIIVLALFAIFINIQIVTPLRQCSALMESKLSVFEPFLAIGNSGLILLVLPLFFLTMMADYPREGISQYFYHVRCSKRIWVMGQILYALKSSLFLVCYVFVISVLLSLDFVKFQLDYSYAVTRYTIVFPNKAGDYVSRLLPENLYNHVSLPLAFVYTVTALALYFLLLALVLLLCAVLQKKLLGLLTDVLLILAGILACEIRSVFMWFFPMAHTIIWLHHTAYTSEQTMPLAGSYLYLGMLNVMLAATAIGICRKYQSF